MFVLAIVCQRVLLGVWTHRTSATGAGSATEDRPIGGNVFAGVTLILRSPYLIGIALFIVGISAVSTLLYFEQLRIVEVTFSDSAAQTRAFARIDWLVQAITVRVAGLPDGPYRGTLRRHGTADGRAANHGGRIPRARRLQPVRGLRRRRAS